MTPGEDVPAELRRLRARLESGDFTATREVADLLASDDEWLRHDARDLFARVCGHDEVALLRRSVEAADGDQELGFVAIDLGNTLSPAAIPLLLEVNDIVEDPDARGYVAQGLDTIMHVEGLDELALEGPDFVRRLTAAATRLAPDVFVHLGVPVFPGDMTTNLVTACDVSLRERKEVVLGDEADLLAAFTGMPFPLAFREVVDEARMRAVNEHVQAIARMRWVRGVKYFHGHPVGASP